MSWIGGYVNIVTMLATAHVVSHATGNTTTLAERIAQASWVDAAVLAVLLIFFTIGAMLAALLTHQTKSSRSSTTYIKPIAVEALLLTLFAIGVVYLQNSTGSHSAIVLGIACLASAAMGLQNATITRVSGSVVRTTHLTGVFTDLGMELVQLGLWLSERLQKFHIHRVRRLVRVMFNHPAFLHVVLHASIIGSFFFGVLAGALIYMHFAVAAMFVPVVFLGWIIYMDWRQPISQIRRLDHAALEQAQGVTLDMARHMSLHRIGVFELHNPRGDMPHRAPNFQQWAQAQANHWPVVVLAFNPMVHIDTNAALDIRGAAEHLFRTRHHLIIANLSRTQRNRLLQSKLDFLLGKMALHENLTDALEVARQIQAGSARRNIKTP